LDQNLKPKPFMSRWYFLKKKSYELWNRNKVMKWGGSELAGKDGSARAVNSHGQAMGWVRVPAEATRSGRV
jgi:hypothetical protein